ncbi:MAG TPA: glutamate-cysteine ligase family protein [Candidatus Binataceae bacterium]|nr:glutamate-cysteine ligase family protein [Candidatus Binataceae bacterium]
MSALVETKEDLIRYFESGAKPREKWRVGTEYEKVAVDAATGRALPYSGPDGVETMMRELIDRFGWVPEDEEKGHLLALSRGPARVTIEPGAQIELSGEQCESIHCARREFSQHVAELIEVGHSHDAVLLGLGMTPVSRIDEIELLPKHRYHIMYPYMARKGRLGQRMMKQTAGVQANLDYSSEADAMRKLRVTMGIVPLVYAMFANSPLADGGLNGYQSYRGHIWTGTDADRCGILEFVFNDGVSFEDYTEYALDVPMYFIIRGEDHHQYVDMTQPPGITFRQYMERGFGNERATIDDWSDHLTTIFTEVRLKKYIESRTADSQPPALMLALPALLKGILYNDDCIDGAWDLVKRWSFRERIEINLASHKAGLEARIGRIALKELSNELLNIASAGLQRQRALNEQGEDETIYLWRLMDQVSSGYSQAALTINSWKGRWNYDVKRLVAGTSYEAEAWSY